MPGRAGGRRFVDSGAASLARAAVAIAATLAIAFVAGASPVHAQDDRFPPPEVLTGTLARIAQSGTVRLGYRDDAAPFSFVSKAGEVHGYSIDLCRAIVDAIGEAVGGAPPRVEFRRVTAADRLDRVASGEVDLECGSTTNTTARRAKVAFSPPIFITGTRLAVPRRSAVRGLGDLAGQSVAVVRGTTNEAVLRETVARRGLRIGVVVVDDLAQAFALLAAGKTDAVAGDDVLLVGQLVRSGERARHAVVGPLLSFERYGIAFARDDPQLAETVLRAMRDLARSGELRRTYNQWFVRALPNGERMGMPMGPELTRAFEMLGMPTE
jgi:glutamate/aspartate transport system substrate-binding protein